MAHGTGFESALMAARAGAEWGFAALYRDLHPGLLRYLYAHEPADAEDLASETWLDVAAGLHRFAGDEDAFRRWLFTIARRRLIDFGRRRARRRTKPMPSERLPERATSSDSEADAIAAASTRAALARLAALPADQAEVLLLRVLADLSVEDVAAILGKRPGTVRVLQHRALARLAGETAAPSRVTPRPSEAM
jgi:RNA polymerase sigma-70 factor, ECF subfamily